MYIDLQSPRPKEHIDSAPRRVQLPPQQAILLDKPSHLTGGFANVIANRNSSSGLRVPQLRDLSALLWYSCRPRTTQIDGSGDVWQSRPSPSAGGTHCIDLLLLRVPGYSEVLMAYDPLGHTLNVVLPARSDLRMALLETAMAVKTESEAVIIWFAAQPHILETYYDNPESLLWRDAGALLAVCYFIAAALGLRCCAIGATGDPAINEIHPQLRGVGGLFIGA